MRAPGSDPDAPPAPTTDAELDARLAEPAPIVLDALAQLPGDIAVLGAAGKMGPTLARMARRALDALGRRDHVLAVSRFSAPEVGASLREEGIDVVRCDLADPDAVAALPDAPNVIFMAGQKFGTTTAPAVTWGLNTVVPALCATRYARSRIVAFSTGNVYPLTPVSAGGADETRPPAPAGEYAMSCLGRERVLEFVAARHATPLAIVRLNYAIDLRYGVLADVAQRVARGQPVDVRMGYVNVIWQGDACAQALACLAHASLPPFFVNVTGAETLRVRTLATRFGELLGRTPVFTGEEAPDALLSDSSRAAALFGPPTVAVETMTEWVADWVARGGTSWEKPTHFGSRDGAF